MRGRKSKPTNLHILHGNPGKRKLNKKAPKPDPGKLECPQWISGEAKKEWDRISSVLERLGLLTELDHAHLEAYCVAYGRWVESEKLVMEKGVLYKTKSGNVMTSPILWVANKALEQMHKMALEFGLTPSSRSRIKMNLPKEKNPYEEWQRLGKKK